MPTRPKVIFFDVNETLLDLTPVKNSVARALEGKVELVPLWFTTLLHYSLVETVAGRYTDFGKIGAAALRMVAAQQDIELTEAEAKRALLPMRNLAPHPEVPAALDQLREAGYRLLPLTNSGADTLRDQMTNAHLLSCFEELLSVEGIGKFKPHREVYSWACEHVGESPERCLLVAAHGWDVAGARWAGLQSAFIARPGQLRYPLAGAPDYRVEDLSELVEVLKG